MTTWDLFVAGTRWLADVALVCVVVNLHLRLRKFEDKDG